MLAKYLEQRNVRGVQLVLSTVAALRLSCAMEDAVQRRVRVLSGQVHAASPVTALSRADAAAAATQAGVQFAMPRGYAVALPEFLAKNDFNVYRRACKSAQKGSLAQPYPTLTRRPRLTRLAHAWRRAGAQSPRLNSCPASRRQTRTCARCTVRGSARRVDVTHVDAQRSRLSPLQNCGRRPPRGILTRRVSARAPSAPMASREGAWPRTAIL